MDRPIRPRYDLIVRLTLIRVIGTIFALAFLFPANSSAQDIVLGILEDNSGHYAGEPNFRAVRAVFEKIGSDWKPFPSDCRTQDCLSKSDYPSEMTWIISFDRKNLGQVTTIGPQDYEWYASVGQQEIVSPGRGPTIGERSEDFADWGGGSVYRPLVANSQPYFNDPESWRPVPPAADLAALLRKQFREKFPKIENCKNPEENTPKPWAYHDREIEIGKTYSSRNGWWVSPLRMSDYRCDAPSEGPFNYQWFAISPTREVKFLREGLWLVDAGDFGNDGKTELLFSVGGYHLGGYELFYDDFKKHVEFEFHYH